MFKLNKSIFLILKASSVMIIIDLIINYKYYKAVITAAVIIIYKLSLLIIIFDIINSCLKLLQL